jgi:hypothetical protein
MHFINEPLTQSEWPFPSFHCVAGRGYAILMGESARNQMLIRVGMEPIPTQITCAKVSSILYLSVEKWGFLKSEHREWRAGYYIST